MIPKQPASQSLAIVTPSYLPDLELCRDLNRSVLELTGPDVVHHIIVPAKDLRSFSGLRGSRTEVHDGREFLPRSFVKTPGLNIWINAERPWPPIRGWIIQQIIKLSVVATLDVRGALLLDSDSVLIRKVSLDTFMEDNCIALYRQPGGVDKTLPRHRLWHEAARKLLGLQSPPPGDLTDYICWPCIWEPEVVRGMLRHVQTATGQSWATAIGRQLHFSEMILYGLFVDEVVGGSPASVNEMQGIVHTAEEPLDQVQIERLLHDAPTDKTVVMLSAKAPIPLEVRRRALESFMRTAPYPGDREGLS
ncbi:DUF6492 family protein [Paenarthrobacter sp. S56]|uniref:DUF6492 family protein n=1 Tax=Paenarthrobacter sp. S56 TaxID=3138179 RepID=UPI00321A2C60